VAADCRWRNRCHLDDDALDVPDERPGGVDGLHVHRHGPSSDPSPSHSLFAVGVRRAQREAGRQGRGVQRAVAEFQRWNAAAARGLGAERASDL
jgi:hypothetical protein